MPHPAALAAGMVMLAFFAALVTASQYAPLTFDAASHAVVSKNIASGYGWATAYHERNLSPYLSSGPTLLLPGALLVALLGNPLWVPALATALLNGLLACLLAYRLYGLCANPWRGFALVLGTTCLFALCDNIWWLTYVGDIPSLLLLLIAACVAIDPAIPSEPRRYCWLGILAGLSFLCRLSTLPGFAAIALYLLATSIPTLRSGSIRPGDWLRAIGCGIAGMLLVILPFLAYMGLEIHLSENQGLADYLRGKQAVFNRISHMGFGGLLQAANPAAQAWANTLGNGAMLGRVLEKFGLWPQVLPLAALAILAGRFLGAKAAEPVDRLGNILLTILAVYAVWYFPAATLHGFERYALYPMLLIAITLCVLLSRHYPLPAIAAMMLAACVSAAPAQQQLFREITGFRQVHWLELETAAYPELAHYHRDAMAAAAFLQSRAFRFPLANCGWISETVELEYLLPRPGNFLDCYRMIEEALVLDETDYLERHPDVRAQIARGEVSDAAAHYAAHQATHAGRYRWLHDVNFTLVINAPTWHYAEHVPVDRLRHQLLLPACEKNILYANPWYKIFECRFEDLRHAIPLETGTPFVGVPPVWQLGS